MTGSRFYDTNVISYAHDGSSPRKRDRARDLIRSGLRDRTMVLSTQVLSEFFVVATRKLRMSPVDVVRELHVLSHARVVEPTLAMVFESIGTSQQNQISYWDALILVSAAAAGCATLYSEDLNHGQQIAGVLIVDPFQDLTA